MSAGTMVAIGIVAVLASGYIGWLFGYRTAHDEAEAAHDLVAVLREGLARTMDFLRAAPNVAIERAARAAVEEFDRTGVLRV